MKRLLTATALTISLACHAFGPVMLPTDGALTRQIERVIDRHDAYVGADEAMTEPIKEADLAQSAAVRALIVQHEVAADALSPLLTPVLDRHDLYVELDGELDELSRKTYLASSSGLRSLMSEARQR